MCITKPDLFDREEMLFSKFVSCELWQAKGVCERLQSTEVYSQMFIETLSRYTNCCKYAF